MNILNEVYVVACRDNLLAIIPDNFFGTKERCQAGIDLHMSHPENGMPLRKQVL